MTSPPPSPKGPLVPSQRPCVDDAAIAEPSPIAHRAASVRDGRSALVLDGRQASVLDERRTSVLDERCALVINARYGLRHFALTARIATWCVAFLSASLASLVSSTAHAQELTRPPSVVEAADAQIDPSLVPEAGAMVLLELTAGVDGAATDVRVVEGASEGLPEALTAAAVAAMGRFRFTPAETASGPIAVRLQYRFSIPPPPPRFASLAGLVRDARSGAGVVGVRVSIETAIARDDARAVTTGGAPTHATADGAVGASVGAEGAVGERAVAEGAVGERADAERGIAERAVAEGAGERGIAEGVAEGAADGPVAEGAEPPAPAVSQPALETVAEVTTDARGAFAFDRLHPGPIVLVLRGDFGTLRVDEVLVAGERLEVVYDVVVPVEEDPGDLDPDEIEIVVVAPPEPRAVVSSRLTAQEAREVPGTGGDVVRVVESLPGVARSGIGSGRLVVWGASPEDTRVFIDGVPIPRLFHEGGVRSVVPPSLVESVELIPGGAGPRYGRGLGGVVAVTTTEPVREGVSGSLAVDTFDASGALGYRDARGSIAGEARVGLVDRLASLVSEDASQFAPIPRYGNGMLRGERRLGDGRRVSFGLLAAADRYQRGVPNADPALVALEERRLGFGRVYASYVHDQGDGTETRATPWFGYERRGETVRFGESAANATQEVWAVGARAQHRRRLSDWAAVLVGLDLEVTASSLARQGTLAVPSREGDRRAFGQPLPDEQLDDSHRAWMVGIAPWIELELRFFGEKLRIAPGLRFDPSLRSVSRRTPVDGNTPEVGAFDERLSVEPRLSAEVDALPWLSLRAAFGRYQQPPAGQDVSAVFGTPLLAPARGWQALGGLGLKLAERLKVEVTGFGSRSTGVAMRSTAISPLLTRAIEDVGEGRARGVQLLVRYDEGSLEELPSHGRFFGWVAYTLSRAERKNAPELDWRLFDFDQTHVLTLVAGWSSRFGLELSARARFASGFPRAPVYGAYYDATRDRYEPIFGPIGGVRLPEFFQLDVRIAQGFEIGDTKLTAYLEVMNVTNRSNVEEIAYASDYSRRGRITGLPIFPVLGLRWDL